MKTEYDTISSSFSLIVFNVVWNPGCSAINFCPSPAQTAENHVRFTWTSRLKATLRVLSASSPAIARKPSLQRIGCLAVSRTGCIYVCVGILYLSLYLFICLLIRTFIEYVLYNSSIHSFVRSFVRSFVHSFIHSFIHMISKIRQINLISNDITVTYWICKWFRLP